MKNVIKNSLLVFALSIISILSFPNVAYAFETYAIDTDEMKELIDRGLKRGMKLKIVMFLLCLIMAGIL